MLLTIAFIAFIAMLIAWIAMPNSSEMPVARPREDVASTGAVASPLSA